MAVTHDAQTRFPATENTADTTTGTRTFTHTPSGTPKGAVVILCGTGTAALCTGVSYGNRKMRLAAAANDTTEAGRVEVWVLERETVPTGAQTVSIFGAIAAPKFCTCSTVAAGTTHTRAITTAFLNTQSTANPAVALSPGGGVTALGYMGLHTGAAAPSATPLANCTLQNNRDYGALAAQTVRRTSEVTGSQTVGVTLGADDWCAAGVAFEEWTPPDGTVLAQQTEGHGTGEFAQGSGTTHTFSRRVLAGENRLMVLEITGEGDGGGGVEVTGVTFNGDAMTKKVEADNASWSWAESWMLAAPDEGTWDVVITQNLDDHISYGIYVYDGADQTDFIQADTTAATGTGASASDTLTGVTADDIIHSVISVDGTGHNITPTSSLGTFWAQADIGHESEGGVKEDTTTGTIGWTWTGSSPYSFIGYAIKQFSSGGGGTPHAENPSDSVTMSDAVVFSLSRAVADTLGLADAQLRDFGKAIADTLGLADSLSSAKDIPMAPADSVTMSDNADLAKGKSVEPADSVTMSDAQTFDRGFSADDSVSMSDNLVRVVDIAPFPADSVTMSDNLASQKDIPLSPADSVTMSDDATPVKGLLRDFADSVTPTDAIVFERGLAAADSVGLADAVTFDRSILLSDTVGLADLAAMAREILFGDTLGLSDDALPLIVKALNVDDTVGLSDNAVFVADKVLNLDDTLPLTDMVTYDRGVTLEDALSLADAVARSYGLSAGDLLAIADLADPVHESGAQDHVLNVDDSVTLSDALSFIRAMTQSDSVVMLDAHQRHLNGILLEDGEVAVAGQGIIIIGRF